MQHSLLPLLILTIVAVCSTKEIPLLNNLELENFFENQDNDNTLNTRLHNRDTEKLFFKRLLNRLPILKPEISNLIYDNKEDNTEDNSLSDRTNKDVHFDDYLAQEYSKITKRLSSQLDKKLKIPSTSTVNQNVKQYLKEGTYSNSVEDNDKHLLDLLDTSNKIEIASPLLILKIRLSYLTNDAKPSRPDEYSYSKFEPLDSTEESNNDVDDDKMLQNEIDSVVKVKREEVNDEDTGLKSNDKSNKIKKRIFSLWSRLQGLHRGHELHHRRHLHAFYGLPDDGGGGSDGTLTAETRATFMRPPGSPLRWG